MTVRFGRRVVKSPQGEWRVGRRWVVRKLPRWRKVTVGSAAAEALALDAPAPEELATALLLAVGAVVFAVIIIPLLLFGIELILLGFLIAAAILGSALLGRPWTVQAVPIGGGDSELTWRVRGWRNSSRVIDEVAASLAAGRTPTPDESLCVTAEPSRRPSG